MKKKLILVKDFILRYNKAFNHAVVQALTTAMLFTWIPARYKISRLEIGEYPEEPVGVVYDRLREMRTVILREAVVKLIVVSILLFILLYIYWLKKYHDIDVMQKIRMRVFKKD